MTAKVPRRKSAKKSTLEQRFTTGQALTSRARLRSVRAAEETIALRALINARAAAGTSTHEQFAVWAAAARVIAEMARERDRILGTVSHEMRQALAAALAAEHVLLARASEPATAKAADVLDRQLLHLARLVDLLLDYSRLMVGPSTIAKVRVDFREVVKETLDACESRAQKEGLELSVSLWNEPQLIDGDPMQLQQLVSNVVHNALRYTRAGGRVRCETVTHEGVVHMIVSDTGRGIAPVDLERIFEPFTRASAEGHGLGVGLAIARRIAQLHGGSITARSEGPGRGATFTLLVPLAPAKA